MKIIKNISIELNQGQDLSRAIKKKLDIEVSGDEIAIQRKSLDARKRNKLKYNYTILIKSDIDINHPDIIPFKQPIPYITTEKKISDNRPFIIGAGPAGLFAALAMVEKGLKPMIFDRGEALEERAIKVKEYWNSGKLDCESNVQFGEGGAGTFSDGKLTSRSNDYYTHKVSDLLIKFGADPIIAYEALPHLGTDKLRSIIRKIRQHLINNGAEFHWRSKLEAITVVNNMVESINIGGQCFKPETIILAPGNGARDTFLELDKHIGMETKPFSIGFRIEHPQHFINTSFYGEKTDISLTGAASYRLTSKYKNRGIYSFCMCPGGYVIASASEDRSIVTNGMSFNNRNNRYANSAVVVTVNDQDFGSKIKQAIEFQRTIETRSFNKENPGFAPAQSAYDFVKGTKSGKKIKCSYTPGIFNYEIDQLFTNDLSRALKQGLINFDHRSRGFIRNGVIIAPETRTSSPVRIVRDKITRASISATNLYPVGEGSGYAGGIISSAMDGYKTGQMFRV